LETQDATKIFSKPFLRCIQQQFEQLNNLQVDGLLSPLVNSQTNTPLNQKSNHHNLKASLSNVSQDPGGFALVADSSTSGPKILPRGHQNSVTSALLAPSPLLHSGKR